MKVMMKQCFVLILALLLAVSLLPVSQGVAADTSETTYVEKLENGITVESVLVVDPPLVPLNEWRVLLLSQQGANGKTALTGSGQGCFGSFGQSLPVELLPLQGDPAEEVALPHQAAVGGAAPGKGHGAGVDAQQVVDPLEGGHVGVAGEEDLGHPHGRRVPGRVPVAVGQEDLPPLPGHHLVLPKEGELGGQLLNAVVAVALHTEDMGGLSVQQIHDPLGVKLEPGIVRPGKDQIPQQDEFRGLFFLI